MRKKDIFTVRNIFTPVCQSFCSQGVGWADAWFRGGVSSRGGVAWSRGGLLPGRGVPGPRGVSAAVGAWSGGVSAPGGCRPPPPQMATVADGTHPTGMHSCC